MVCSITFLVFIPWTIFLKNKNRKKRKREWWSTRRNSQKNAQDTLPETNIAHENPIFPGKYHQNCGFSMAMLVSGSVTLATFGKRPLEAKLEFEHINLSGENSGFFGIGVQNLWWVRRET